MNPLIKWDVIQLSGHKMLCVSKRERASLALVHYEGKSINPNLLECFNKSMEVTSATVNAVLSTLVFVYHCTCVTLPQAEAEIGRVG